MMVVPQDIGDYLPHTVLASAPVRVYWDITQNDAYYKQLSWDNRYSNVLWGCSGAIMERYTDEQLIANVRGDTDPIHRSCQASKITRQLRSGGWEIAHHIGVIVQGPYGYDVRAIFQSDPWVPDFEVTDYFVRKERNITA